MDPEFPPRVYFNEFKDCALNLLVLYWYHPPNYWDFMAFGETLNMEILKRFNEEGIDFAFPSQTVYVANDDHRQLKVKQI
jgi:MscS family membrane protein